MSQELAVQTSGPMELADPQRYVAQASRLATVLGKVIVERRLFTEISGRKFVTVEGWTLLANMLGVFPIVEWSRRCDDSDGHEGWEARVRVENAQGQVIGAGEAMCMTSESRWASRDDFARRAMAQTRATSRALRNPLGFVVKLAGYEATGAEEMPRDGD